MREEDVKMNADIYVGDDEYPDNPLPSTPGEGFYTFKPLGKLLEQRDRESGEPVLRNGYPVLLLPGVEIVAPFQHGQRVDGIWHQISTTPKERTSKSGQTRLVSQAADLLRAFDRTVQAFGTEEIAARLREQVEARNEFTAYLYWSAYDPTFVREERARLGLTAVAAELGEDDRKQLNRIYQKAKNFSMTRCRKSASGKFLPVWVGPSGEDIPIRLAINRYVPSGEEAPLGPIA